QFLFQYPMLGESGGKTSHRIPLITIETSRSGMELLSAFGQSTYPNANGPGVHDIHSPSGRARGYPRRARRL
ncbi:MAG: hypothetical protein EA417_22215, partial [Gammaproteobacteria bacterium]